MAHTPSAGDEVVPKTARESVLDPVERVSEVLFGLFMALTFVGAISVAESGRAEIRALLIAAIGCNIAWGLVDAVMYLVRTIADRGKYLATVREVRAASDPASAREILRLSLSSGASALVTDAEIEGMRGRIAELADVPERPSLTSRDAVAGLMVFLLVVAATFPVVLPFVMIGDVGWAKAVSRIIALTMLFVGGIALGRYAGYGRWRVGFMMMGLGAALVGAVMALGG